MFGSQAKGHAHAWSDIDLALVSGAFAADPTESQIQLMLLAASIDWRIEPHLFAPDDFNISHPLVSEINSSGVSLIQRKEGSRIPKDSISV
jgi:predicted nucleotidyltransferase